MLGRSLVYFIFDEQVKNVFDSSFRFIISEQNVKNVNFHFI